jgi:methylmalonyl-CoA/ethylmalonyl-CoA epimerase
MSEGRLDHLGIAVISIDESLDLYRALGLEAAGIETVPGQGVRVAMLPAGTTRIELLEPLGPDSPVAKHLERRGPGLHHVCVEVEDIGAVMRRLRGSGVQLLSDEPQPGAGGALVCFIHPKSAGGVLIELSQPAAGRNSGDDD